MHKSHTTTSVSDDATRKGGDAMSKALLAGCVLLVAGSGYVALSGCVDEQVGSVRGGESGPRTGGAGRGFGRPHRSGAGGMEDSDGLRTAGRPGGHGHPGRGRRSDGDGDANRTRGDEPPQRRGQPHALPDGAALHVRGGRPDFGNRTSGDEQPPQRPDEAGRPEFGGNHTGDADHPDVDPSCFTSSPPARALALVAAAAGVTGAVSVLSRPGRRAAIALLVAIVLEAVALAGAVVAPLFFYGPGGAMRGGAPGAEHTSFPFAGRGGVVGVATFVAAVLAAAACRCVSLVRAAGSPTTTSAEAASARQLPIPVGPEAAAADCAVDTSCAVDVKDLKADAVYGVPVQI